LDFNSIGLSDKGNIRTSNEDSFLIDEELALHIVCDGMGGHEHGELASKLACAVIQKNVNIYKGEIKKYFGHLNQENRAKLRFVLDKAINCASAEIHEKGQELKSIKGIGTTVVLVLISKTHAFLAHVGDSRVYLKRKEKLYQLTEDHTMASQLVKNGHASLKEVENIPGSGALFQAVGYQKIVKVDQVSFELRHDDQIILCSDGFTKYANDKKILEIFKNQDFEYTAKFGVDYANEMGGSDNTTIVAINISQEIGTSSEIDVALKIEVLREIPLFQNLSYNELTKVLEISRTYKFDKSSKIITEGELGDELFIILLGNVDVLVGDTRVDQLSSGKYFGEMAMIDKRPRSATALATSYTIVMGIRRSHFKQLIQNENALGVQVLWNFTHRLSGMMRNVDQKILGMKKL
jgi:serine/threonine protein phosphatase PrpC